MKPPPFEYHRPETLHEALSLLAEHGAAAKVLAGGQSLMPVLAFRLVRPTHVIDINRLVELDHCELDDRSLSVGAIVRHRTIELLDGLAVRCAAMADAISQIGHVAIRNRGTVGGRTTSTCRWCG